MGLLRSLLTAPVSGPVKGALWIAGQIHDTADAQMHDPAALRQALQELEDQLLHGEISEAAYDSAEDRLLQRLQRARS